MSIGAHQTRPEKHGRNHTWGLNSARRCLRAIVPMFTLRPYQTTTRSLIRSQTCAPSFAVTRGPSNHNALQPSGCVQSSGGPNIASNTGPDSLRLQDTSAPLAIDCGSLRRDILQFQARAMLKKVQVGRSCQEVRQWKE